MIDHRYTITSDATDEVESLLMRFERDRDHGPVDLADYTPSRDDPAYDCVVTELARIDLEHRYNNGIPPDAKRYVELFPEVFKDSHLRTQLAFEEYRLRRRGGEDVSGEEIGDRYAVDGSRWPIMKLGGDATSNRSISRRFTDSELLPPSVHYPAVGETFAGYPLVTRIGEGAFSRVFLARQPDLASRLVVLKVTPLSTDESDRLASLQHTAIIPVYSVHREGDLSCICMPFLGATTLSDLSASGERWASLDGPAEELVSTILDRRRSTIWTLTDKPATSFPNESATSNASGEKKFSGSTAANTSVTELAHFSSLGYVDALLELVFGAVEGLAYAHHRGIIHRDLKPANILVADDGTPVLLDFNLAVSSHEPKTRVVGGTLPYMSPQQLAALQTGAAADKRDDVFSMGVILYELLSGRLPFNSPGSGQGFDLESVIADRVVTPKPIRQYNPRVSAGLESIISRCIAPAREQRYADATELLEDLNRHRQHLPLKYAPERSIGERLAKWSARHPRLSSATSVATLAAALLVMGSVLIWQRGEHIARLNVESKFLQFHNELPRAITALSSPGYEPELLSSGLQQSARLLNQWHVDADDWQQLSEVDRLDDGSRKRLRRELAKLAYSMADAEFHIARQSDSSARVRLNEKAMHWNKLAGDLDPKLQPLADFQAREIGRKLDGHASDHITEVSVPAAAELDLRAMWAKDSGNAVLWRELTEQQLDQQPTNATHWINLALANNRLGDVGAAVTSFDISNRLQPRSMTTLVNRGICYLDLGKPQLAFNDFTACLRINAKLMVPRFNRALASRRLGNYRAAIEDLNLLVRNGHTSTRILLMRSEVHDAVGDHDAAKADRRAALEIPPHDVNDWTARGISRLSTAPQAALADFMSALSIQPNDFHAINNAAHVYAEKLDEPEKAIELLTRLISIRPESASAVASRGILRARIADADSALADAKTASELLLGPIEQLQIAGIYAMASDEVDRDENRNQAFRWLARALRTDVGLAPIARDDSDLSSLRVDPRFSQLIGNAIRIDGESTPQ